MDVRKKSIKTPWPQPAKIKGNKEVIKISLEKFLFDVINEFSLYFVIGKGGLIYIQINSGLKSTAGY